MIMDMYHIIGIQNSFHIYPIIDMFYIIDIHNIVGICRICSIERVYISSHHA